MHRTSPAPYMYRPPYVHIYSDAGVEIPRYRHDSAPAHDTDYQHQPWHQMAHAYAWVDDNHYSRRANHSRKTEQWVLEQRVYLDHTHSTVGKKVARKTWEEVAYAYELEGEEWKTREAEWKRREAEIRRKVMQREAERTRIVQEELRRAEKRIRQRREAERQRILEERARAYLERREHEKRETAKEEKMILDAWTSYETQWAAMQASKDPLTFSSIPWPVLYAPDQPESMEPADIASFLLSPVHSESQTRRERIRAAQLRWHPDRFRRYMGRVAETDKAAVEEGVGIVARCLNDLVLTLKSE